MWSDGERDEGAPEFCVSVMKKTLYCEHDSITIRKFNLRRVSFNLTQLCIKWKWVMCMLEGFLTWGFKWYCKNAK